MKLKKLLCLPSVVDLGWSTTEALPMRSFQPDVLGQTWEDYHELMKKDYPIRFFLAHTLRHFVAVNIVMPLERLHWYIRDSVFRKMHLLDLRQPSCVPGCDDYNSGYLDPRQQMLYACMNTLERFIVESDAKNHLMWLEQELSACDPEAPEYTCLVQNCELYREALVIHRWWNIDRKSDYLHIGKLSDYSTPELRTATLARWDTFEMKEEEMMLRLVKIRCGLWN